MSDLRLEKVQRTLQERLSTMCMCEKMVKDTREADRKGAEAWRFRHVKSKERQLLEAGLKALVEFLREAYGALRARGATRPAREQPVY